MITFLFGLLALLSPTTGDLATGVHRTSTLDLETAFVHAHAAMTAAAVYDVPPEVLLSIAYHESRYDPTARTAEPGGKVSCGVMTPVPGATCTHRGTLGGYLVGAAHVREWIDASRGNLRTALVGYAGGYALIARCARGPVIIRRVVDVCRTPEVFLARARRIRGAPSPS